MRAMALAIVCLTLGCALLRYEGPLIDVHAHFETDGSPPINPKIGLAALQSEMGLAKVSRVVLMAVVPDHGDEHQIHDALSSFIKAHPKRIVGVGHLRPEQGELAVKELERFPELGFKGVRIVPQN